MHSSKLTKSPRSVEVAAYFLACHKIEQAIEAAIYPKLTTVDGNNYFYFSHLHPTAAAIQQPENEHRDKSPQPIMEALTQELSLKDVNGVVSCPILLEFCGTQNHQEAIR